MSGAWRKIMAGWYVYENAAGKELAYVERAGRTWQIRVLPLGDQARAFTLSLTPTTMREAKRLARNVYVSTSRKLVEERLWSQNDPM